MLLLTRHINQSIIIDHPDGPITVLVCKIERIGRPVTMLGFDAPKSVIIRRGEVIPTVEADA